MSKPGADEEQTPTEPLMTQSEMAAALRQILKAIKGDPLSPNREKRGLAPRFWEMERDYYGHENHPGTQELVRRLWELRIKVIGGCVALSAVISFITWLLENVVLPKH